MKDTLAKQNKVKEPDLNNTESLWITNKQKEVQNTILTDQGIGYRHESYNSRESEIQYRSMQEAKTEASNWTIWHFSQWTKQNGINCF